MGWYKIISKIVKTPGILKIGTLAVLKKLEFIGIKIVFFL